MTEFPHDTIKPFTDGGEKGQQVSRMFNEIAGRYDFMNRFLSAGIDRSWRKKAIRCLEAVRPQSLLDVATGTGDMAIRAARALRPQAITGVDISEGMLAIGRQKITAAGLDPVITLQVGNSESLPFSDAHFDSAMVAFGVRNFQHLEQGLSEILRVLQPGGKLVVLEFSRPRLPVVKRLYEFYMGTVAPQLAGLFGQNKQAYRYLNESAKAFPEREQFTAILESVGFISVRFQPLTLGICCIYEACKPGMKKLKA